MNSNNKGKRGELELAKELTRIFGVACRRGQQYCGIEGQDVVGLPGIHIEAKRTERLSLYAAMNQAVEDATGDDVPVVFHRKNLEEWVAIVRLDDLKLLADAIRKLGRDDNTTRTKAD